MRPITCILGRLGSRFSLVLDPVKKRVLHGVLGRFLDVESDLCIGVDVEGCGRRALPFTQECDSFPFVEQEFAMTGVSYRCHWPDAGLRFDATITAPFYPQNARVSTAPAFYVDLRVRRSGMFHVYPMPDGTEPIRGVVSVRFSRSDVRYEAKEGCIRSEYVDDVFTRTPYEYDQVHSADIGEFRCAECMKPLTSGVLLDDGIMQIPFELSGIDDEAKLRFVWAAHTGNNVLLVGHDATPFKYTEYFRTVDDVVAFACREEDRTLQLTRFFDRQFRESSLSKDYQDLLAFTFQSYISNTWWTKRPDGSDWFSVWEGNCQFHSTVDVEYNIAPMYFALWPELFELTLSEWTDHEKPAGGGHAREDRSWMTGTFMSHDIGQTLAASGQVYPHEMEIEENANFILLAGALWRFTGKHSIVDQYFPLISRLATFLLEGDRTGSGIPSVGVNNTIDDASPAVQYAKEQTYLGMKALCAFDMAAQMADELGEDDQASVWRAQIAKIRKTLDDRCWLSDHYGVCVDRTTDGLVDSWTGQPLPSGELGGWDAYSLYLSNGLLCHLLVGSRPPLDYDRIRTDLESSWRESLVEYGCTHSSADKSNLWVSQNLWRDFIAAYLGIDLLDMVERYWAFQVNENLSENNLCFIDTYPSNNLSWYPRGITGMGVLFAAPGVSIDRVKGELCVNPIRRTGRWPLLALADWESMRVPWIEIGISDSLKITNDDLLGELRIGGEDGF